MLQDFIPLRGRKLCAELPHAVLVGAQDGVIHRSDVCLVCSALPALRAATAGGGTHVGTSTCQHDSKSTCRLFACPTCPHVDMHVFFKNIFEFFKKIFFEHAATALVLAAHETCLRAYMFRHVITQRCFDRSAARISTFEPCKRVDTFTWLHVYIGGQACDHGHTLTYEHKFLQVMEVWRC